MLNVFLQYSIAINFLILLWMRACTHSCVYNRTTMLDDQKFILARDIGNVKRSLDYNFSTCFRTKKDTSLSSLDLCNNVTKNLVYFGCLLNHHTRNLLPSNSSAVADLRGKLIDLVTYSNELLCIKSSNKKHPRKEQMHSGKWRKEICKLNETLHSFATFWQEFRASIDCT
ncbi:uncharacterized protein ACNLHF_022536 isoform 2-T2 [Anomaloglossus baeobatrachus]